MVILTCAPFGLFLLLQWIFPLPLAKDYSVVITDARGEVANAFLTRDQKWRLKTELTEISPLLRRTLIAKEDRYFYRHPGINPFAIGRAAFMNLLKGRRTSGASTITMQVARALEPRPRNFWSKCVEAFRALELEWRFSKDEILQLYLNLVPYGGNVEGVKAASLLYFGKAPDHLSLAEITALSVIPNRPSTLVIGKRNEAIAAERNRWLRRFAEEGVFTQKEIEDALAEPLTATRQRFPQEMPHLARRLKNNGGTQPVQTAIDRNLQQKAEKLTEDYVRTLRSRNIHNAAVVIVDNRTQVVIGYVGSAGFRDTTDGGQVNGAAAVRQPGSTLKPLLYGLCIDEGLLTPRRVIEDVPIHVNGYAPENYDRQFNGAVTMEYALEHSLNIPAVRSLQQLGKEKLVQKLVSADFRQIRKDQQKLGLSLILGGCGATLEELTGLFSAIANEGIYRPLRYTKDQPATAGRRLLSPEAAYMLTEMLSQVNRPDFPLSWSATEHLPRIAWKTGTSYGRRDAWSIGYNRNYTVGVWVGNFSGTGVPELSGANTATPLLFRLFNTLDYNSDAPLPAPPKDYAQRQVCSESGLPPGPDCDNRVLDAFIPLISTTSVCRHLQEWKVAPDSSIAYCEACAPANGYVRKKYRIISPELADYYTSKGQPFVKPPPHNPACEKLFREGGPQIVSPQNGAEYFLSKRSPEPLLLKASAGTDVRTLYWYINDVFYKKSGAGEKLFFLPNEGPVRISCTDDKGRNRNVLVHVRRADL